MVNAWKGYGQQKRFGEDNCRNRWVLNLDADEVVTPALAAEIEALFEGGEPACRGYRFRLLTVYPGHSSPRWGADGNNCIRLYDRTAMRYRDHVTDDTVVPSNNTVGQLRNGAWHYSFRSFAHIHDKLAGYAAAQTPEKAKARNIALLWLRAHVTELPLQFLKFMIVRRHITGGATGARYAWAVARAKQVRMATFLHDRAP